MMFRRQSAWSSHVDKRIDDLRADLGDRMTRIENRLDAFLDMRGANCELTACSPSRYDDLTGTDLYRKIGFPKGGPHAKSDAT